MSLHINKQLTKNASLAHAKNAGNRNEVQVKVNSEPHATLNEYEPSRPRAGLTLSNSRDYGNAPRIRVARTATPPLTPRIRGARTERGGLKGPKGLVSSNNEIGGVKRAWVPQILKWSRN
ncbi:hypothetical protein J6590_026798 [Homalodisca vitripennis]|nr:hypothetical protein J6590_026798 [Homalodisca vitripennis]